MQLFQVAYILLSLYQLLYTKNKKFLIFFESEKIMRIIAGKHRSRVLKTLEGQNTRPMTDRMKESVFNTIGPYFDGETVLDLFGGSGALSLEAISRGASHAYISEIARDAFKVIMDNITSLKENDNVTALNCDYKIALKRLSNTKFDIVFLDPPYRLNIVSEIIDELIKNDMLSDDAIIVCHYVKGNQKIVDSLKLRKNYAYGSSEVAIYENSK